MCDGVAISKVQEETNHVFGNYGKVVEIGPDEHGVRMAKANFGGIVKQVCLEYTEVDVGDCVLVSCFTRRLSGPRVLSPRRFQTRRG